MSLDKLKGKFITFEGVEGSGKSTQVKLLSQYLADNGIENVLTREPGGTPGAEEIRNLLINGAVNKWDGITETLLFFAARRNHVEQLIKPAKVEGKAVISDRFYDSTYAYQVYAHGANRADIEAVHKVSIGNFAPDITFILDIGIEDGLKRAELRGVQNRYEKMGLDFHKRVRQGFMEISQAEPERCFMIDASGTIEAIHGEIRGVLERRKFN